jgi:hypothetical protein
MACGVGGSLLLCLVLAAVSALTNRRVLSLPQATDRLTALDKARLAETLHLKRRLGNQVWAGWGETDIPVLVWNDDYSFLVGMTDPPAPWEPVPEDTFEGETYYRRPTDNPQNFAVHVGDRWVASMATKWQVDAFVIEMIRDVLPVPLDRIIPYRLLMQPSEVQMTGVLHESFHVYQAQVALDRLNQAEAAHGKGAQYWTVDADKAVREAWETEIDLLVKALKSEGDEQAKALAREFLSQRDSRRMAAKLSSALVEYERHLEWEEGLAKYVELAIWREASGSLEYEPLPDVTDDPAFRGYCSFRQRWSQEIGQMKRQATREGETRFYYTGMAQAMLLDRLLPGWQDKALSKDIWLEMLLAEAVE